MKVVATEMYAKLGKKAVELNKIPEAGEVFEIADNKFELLNGHNQYNAIFVERYEKPVKAEVIEIEEVKEETKPEKKPVKKAKKKKK